MLSLPSPLSRPPRAAAIAARLPLFALLLSAAVRGQGTDSAPPPPADERIELSPFEVAAVRDDGYAATNSLSGTKIAMPLRDLPLSMEIVTEDFIEDIAAFDFVDTLQYSTAASIDDVSGVNATVRGFASTFNFRNGFRYYARRDSVNIQRVEVVKGPAALLYGNVQPGGVVNVLTKRPMGQNRFRASASYTSFDGTRGTVDIDRRVSDSVNARLSAAHSVNPTHRDHSDNTFKILAPVFTWRIGPRTTATVDLEFSRIENKTPSLLNQARNNVPVYASVAEGGLAVPTTYNFRGPDGRLEDNVNNYFASIEHRFTNDFTLRLATNVHDRVTYPDRPEALTIVAAPAGNLSGLPTGTLANRYNWRRSAFDNFMHSYSADLLWRGEAFNLNHQVLAGFTLQDDTFEGVRYRDTLDNGNDRVYFASLADPTWAGVVRRPEGLTYTVVPNEGTPEEHNTVAQTYLTHQLRMFDNRFITLAGVYLTRLDNYQRVTGGTRTAPVDTATRYKAEEIKPQVGFIVRPVEPVSLFALYATSVFPQAGADSRDGFDRPFAPTEAESLEAGVKLDLWGEKIIGSISGYSITEQGRIINDPNAPNKDSRDRAGRAPTDAGFNASDLDPAFPIGARRQIGEGKSEGVDVDLLFRVVPGLQSKVGYSYLDTFVSRDLTATRVGQTNPGTAKHRFSIWNKYSFSRESRLKGFSIGAGATWASEANRGYIAGAGVYGEPQKSAQASVSYARKLFGQQWRFAVNGRNLSETPVEVRLGQNPRVYRFPTERSFIFTAGVSF